MDTQNYAYYSYQLPEEKQLHVVIRGIPSIVDVKDAEEELKIKNFHPFAVFRMKNIQKQPIPLLLVLVPKREENIYLNNNPTKSVQCRNCQQYGHSETKCCPLPKCLKCAGPHHTASGKIPIDSTPICANCKGNHTSIYGVCPKHPTNIMKQQATKS